MAELNTLGDVIKTAYEGETDTNAFTDAEKSKLAAIEAAADVTDAANVEAAGALMDSEVVNLADVKAFDPADHAPASHSHTAFDVTDFSTAADSRIAAASIGDLSDVVIAGVTDGQLLAWSNANGQFEAVDPAAGGGDVTSVNGFTGAVVLNTGDIDDITLTSPANKEVLEFDGTNWVNVISPNFKWVYNPGGTTIPAGTLVHVTGSVAGYPIVTVADKDTDTEVSGMLFDALGPAGFGNMQTQGTIQETFIDTSSVTAGDPVYLGDDGAFTTTKPTSGNVIHVGVVGIEAASDGSLLLDMPASVVSLDEIAGAGTAAASDTGDFATAAQGILAGTALQSVAGDTTPQLSGELDAQSNIIGGFKGKTVAGVSGTLTDGAHSGNMLKTTGNVTVPTNEGFTCQILAGGAHTVTFNGTTTAAMAAGDLMNIRVIDATTIVAALLPVADQVEFT